MPRTLTLNNEDEVKMYFTGELDQKIKKFKLKKSKSWPDKYYNTLHSVSCVVVMNNSNGVADPTGEKATRLAYISEDIANNYIYYSQLKKTITEVLDGRNGGEICLLKAKLKLVEGGITGVAKELGISYRQAVKKVNKIIKLLNAKVTKIVK